MRKTTEKQTKFWHHSLVAHKFQVGDRVRSRLTTDSGVVAEVVLGPAAYSVTLDGDNQPYPHLFQERELSAEKPKTPRAKAER